MSITVVRPEYRTCPSDLQEYNRRKNAFREVSLEEHRSGLENKERILGVLRSAFAGSGLNILLHGSQVYNPQQGEDFDLIGLYRSRESLRPLGHFCNLDELPVAVANVLGAILGRKASSLLDFLESDHASFAFRLRIYGAKVALNVFSQPVFERVAVGGFNEDCKKIRVIHPDGPFKFKRAALFDGSEVWIPSETSMVQFDSHEYWLRHYYGWLLENGFTTFSGTPKTSISHIVTSEIVLEEEDRASRLIESAEKAFANAFVAYSTERRISGLDPCNAFVRAERFRPDFAERLRERVMRHVPSVLIPASADRGME